MNIVYITQFIPYPLDNGASIKTYSTLSKLGNDNNLVLFCFAKRKHRKYLSRAKKELLKSGIHVEAVIENPSFITTPLNSNLGLFVKSVLSLDPFNAFRFRNSFMKRLISNYFNKNDIDICWIDTTNMAQFIPPNFSGKKILETHNVQSSLYKDMFFNEGNFVFKLFAFHEWIKYLVFQHRYFPHFNSIIAISKTDKRKLKSFVDSKKISVLYPTVPLPQIKKIKTIPHSMLFVGSMYWYPNRDGVHWFIKKVFPRVQNTIPDVNLTLVGESAPEFKFPQYKGIKFKGYQKDLSKYYNQTSLVVVPIRYGGGIRIKILEALSYNVPVIATERAIEGLSSKDRARVISVSNEYDMTREIIKILQNAK